MQPQRQCPIGNAFQMQVFDHDTRNNMEQLPNSFVSIIYMWTLEYVLAAGQKKNQKKSLLPSKHGYKQLFI